MPSPPESPYDHGFVRLAAAVPPMAVSRAASNTDETVRLLRRAAEDHIALVVFPELGLVGYTSGDLLHQQALLDAALEGLERVRAATEDLANPAGIAPVAVVGLPVRVGTSLYNCAAVVHRGSVLGLVPKSYLPNYREFYEKRHFSPARAATVDEVTLLGRRVAFGTDVLVVASDVPDLVVGIEVCEDLWAPVPPSTYAALAGATVVLNLSGSNATIGKADYRRELCAAHSARTIAAYA